MSLLGHCYRVQFTLNTLYSNPWAKINFINDFYFSICQASKPLLGGSILTRSSILLALYQSGPGDLASNPGRAIPKTFKMVLDNSLLNTQQYKVRIKGKVEQSREWSSTLLGVVAI